MRRPFFVWLHRWVGLVMAAFLILIGLTGSLLAFANEINHLVSPRFYAHWRPGPPLDLAALIDKAEALVPQGQVYWIVSSPDQAEAMFRPRQNPATRKPYELSIKSVFLNPWSGSELARLKHGERDPRTLTTIVLQLHESLLLGSFGIWVLGIVALLWTIDCFVAFYLTLPASAGRFWKRWQQAWQVKWRASAFRVNFDLHRAGGLWLWLVLFVFAWSSVAFNLPAVYERATKAVFDYRPHEGENATMPSMVDKQPRPPRIDFRGGLYTARHLMAEQAAERHFSLGRESVLDYDADARTYFYNVKSSRDIWDRDHFSFTTLTFDADTGALRQLHIPTGEHSGNTVTLWLMSLHEAWVFGLPYRIFVCVLGLAIAMLSYTGVYIWWKKRQVRIKAAGSHQPVVRASLDEPI